MLPRKIADRASDSRHDFDGLWLNVSPHFVETQKKFVDDGIHFDLLQIRWVTRRSTNGLSLNTVVGAIVPTAEFETEEYAECLLRILLDVAMELQTCKSCDSPVDWAVDVQDRNPEWVTIQSVSRLPTTRTKQCAPIQMET